MSKAYDRIEWSYLQLIILKLGFSEACVSKITKIISIVSYYFARGAEEFGPLVPGRGLR